MNPCPLLIYLDEFGTTTDSIGPAQAQRLFAADRQALPALGAAALQDESPVFRAHANQKSMCTAAAAFIRLESPLPFHRLLRECEVGVAVLRLSANEERTFNGIGRFLTVSIARAFVLQSPVLRRAFTSLFSPRSACRFGLSPKFSTPVEKTVEILDK